MKASETSFGYRQELKRSMSGFSSFAISFSLISVLTGIFANFNFAFREVGGWIIWAWLLVAIGQFLIARVMAGLSIRFPIAGYGYQWTARMVNPHFGFLTGWMLLIQFLTGFPGIVQTAALTMSDFWGWQLTGQQITLLTLLIIGLVTSVHLIGIRLASGINDLGVYAELLGVIMIIGSLSWMVMKTADPIVFSSLSRGQYMDGNTPGFSALASSLLLGAWCLTGFEAAADLAEETHAPEKNVPRAVIRSLLSAAAAGILILSLLVISSGDIGKAQQNANPLMHILQKSMGADITKFILLTVIISILACAIASMATASRLLFSMSRDGMLPFSGILSKVHAGSQTPRGATLAVCIFSSLVVVTLSRIEVITSVSALASFIGYAGIMYGAAKGKHRFLPIAAMCWSLLVIAALSIPETTTPGFDTKHLPAISTFIATLAGLFIYLTYTKRRLDKGIAGPPQTNQNS